MKTIINEWDLLEITVIFNETSEIARFTLKSTPIEDPETSRKSSKTITQAKTFPQVVGAGKNSTSPLYRETTKSEHFLDKKNAKITQRSHKVMI